MLMKKGKLEFPEPLACERAPFSWGFFVPPFLSLAYAQFPCRAPLTLPLSESLCRTATPFWLVGAWHL